MVLNCQKGLFKTITVYHLRQSAVKIKPHPTPRCNFVSQDDCFPTWEFHHSWRLRRIYWRHSHWIRLNNVLFFKWSKIRYIRVIWNETELFTNKDPVNLHNRLALAFHGIEKILQSKPFRNKRLINWIKGWRITIKFLQTQFTNYYFASFQCLWGP